jgi:hypothetical protein
LQNQHNHSVHSWYQTIAARKTTKENAFLQNRTRNRRHSLPAYRRLCKKKASRFLRAKIVKPTANQSAGAASRPPMKAGAVHRARRSFPTMSTAIAFLRDRAFDMVAEKQGRTPS